MNDKSLKILLIEDNAGDVRLIREMLAEVAGMSYSLESASRLSAGLECLIKQQFDVVLLDLGLPDSQGLETLNEIYTQTPTTPIVVLTGLGDEAIANQAVREGAQDYLSKGDINGRVLWRVIRYAIERKSAEEALHKEKQFAESLIDTAQAIILVLDTTGRIVNFNRYMEEVSGYHLEEVQGRDWFSTFLPEDDQYRIKELFLKAIDGIQTRSSVNAIITKDGRIRDIEWYDKVLKDQNGDTVGLLVIGQDVTERKKLEVALEESEQWYRHIFDNAPFGIGFASIDGKVINLNKAMEVITGYSAEEFTKINLADTYVNKADRKALLQEVRRHGGVIDYPLELRRKDGTEYDATLSVRLTSIGDRQFLQTVLNDVTERKRAEEELRLSEQNFRDSIENSPLGVRIATEDGKTLYANRALLDIYGYSSLEELEAVPRKQRHTPSSYAEHKKRVKKRKLGEYIPPNYEVSIVRKDGEVRELSVSRGEVLWDGERQFQVLYQDITERKQAEQALSIKQAELQIILDSAPSLIFYKDKDNRFIRVNKALAELTGLSIEQVEGRTAYELFPSDTELYWQDDLEVIASGQAKLNIIEPLQLATGTHWVRTHKTPYLNDKGEIVGIIGFSEDITERRQAEEALRRSEEKYRSLFEQSIDPVFITTQEGIIVDSNQSMINLFGYTREELIGMDVRKIYINPEDRAKLRQEIGQQGFVKDWEIKLRKKDGTEVECLLTSVARWDDGKNILGYQGIIRDISQRKLAEAEKEEIEQKAELASRLAAVGEMASGIAHEINNPLTGVIGYAQLLSKKELPEDIKEGLEVINDGAQRVAGIIKRLLTFARQYKPEQTLVNINSIIEATINLRVYHLKTSNIKLTTRLAPDLPTTIADAGQLQQVFLNLIVNAETEMKQAHGKGKLSVRTRQMDNIIRISFKDDGPGIIKKNLERIFNPFFTTRKVGEGTGLGLSVCHGIIAEHGGRIHAESKLGRGATFIVELPVITADEQMELPELIAEGHQKVTNARILVVDDEPGVRQFLAQALTDEGHEVQSTDNSGDALEMIKSQQYSLILLDIKMPDMSGIELYKRIQKIDKSLAHKVVFITGDVLGVNTAAFLSRTKAPHIVKPFDTEQLNKDISRILTEGARVWVKRHGKARV